MRITNVVSTTLATVAYDDVREQLQLEFRSGAVYQYHGVPAAVHQGLLNAPSKGSYFNRFVREHFPYALCSHGHEGMCRANDGRLPWQGR
ncbi:MAG TPA: KTSC domain-containing protein [Terriglobia bacterium]|nr:KTSC domain-containing protein [Terriglobia bacterium]